MTRTSSLGSRRHAIGQKGCAGVTLVELIVVLAVLGVMAAVTGLAFRAPRPADRTDVWAAGVTDARARALATGAPVSVVLDARGADAMVTAYPDGSVLADSALGVDRLTGRTESRAP